MGRAAAFSFYPGKNLGACGEAGAITTNDSAAAEKMKMLRDHGQSRKYFHDVEGYNGRLDALQAGILHIKLGHLKPWNDSRRAKALEYNRLLCDCTAVSIPREPSWSRGVYHLYVIRSRDRDNMMKQLKARGIGSAIHYPIPLHLQKAYTSLNYNLGDFPITEGFSSEILSLPMFPQLDAAHQAFVVNEIHAFSRRMETEPVSLT